MTAMERSHIHRRAVNILRERNDENSAKLETLDRLAYSKTSTVDIVTSTERADALRAITVRRWKGWHQIPLRETSLYYPPRTAGRSGGDWRMELV